MNEMAKASLKMPEGWKKRKIEPAAGKNPTRTTWSKKQPGWQGTLQSTELGEAELPADNPEKLAEGLRSSLDVNTALIEAGLGQTGQEHTYWYMITKQRQPDKKGGQSLTYGLVLVLIQDGLGDSITGSFSETGNTGIREERVFEMLLKNHPTEEIRKYWSFDPYDPKRTGFRMNQSEKAELDSHFPFHPLSQVRQFIREFTAAN